MSPCQCDILLQARANSKRAFKAFDAKFGYCPKFQAGGFKQKKYTTDIYYFDYNIALDFVYNMSFTLLGSVDDF